MKIVALDKDLQDGVFLFSLLEILAGEQIKPKVNKNGACCGGASWCRQAAAWRLSCAASELTGGRFCSQNEAAEDRESQLLDELSAHQEYQACEHFV
jgi:hypothetical protein